MTRVRAGWMPLLLAAVAAALVAALGATITDLGPWYRGLRQPDWAPPDFAYGLVWTIVFATCALAAVVAWGAARSRREAEGLIGLFALNGFLNILWSLLFFRLHRPDWALWEGIPFWLSIVALIVACGRQSRVSALLLLPYLAWVSLALWLNLAVVRLNGPFA